MAVRQNNEQPKSKPIQYTYIFKVNRSTELLEFLIFKLKTLSRNSIKTLLSQHKVLVNGSVTTQFNFPLAKDDEVKIAKQPVNTPVVKLPKKRLQGTQFPIRKMIIFEDDEFLAINKPHGLLSVESDKSNESAYSYAVDYLKSKDPKARPYILHRIDKETSGVLVFAKDIKVHSKLRNHWNQDVRMREYYAVVLGKFIEKSGTMTAYLDENRNHMVFVNQEHIGKKSITHYEVVAENAFYSLLRVTIDTGRKNQIRVMMADAGHPIVGDEKYGDPNGPMKRLGLHASRLEFVNPVDRRRMVFDAGVPKEFTNLFKNSDYLK